VAASEAGDPLRLFILDRGHACSSETKQSAGIVPALMANGTASHLSWGMERIENDRAILDRGFGVCAVSLTTLKLR